MLDVSKEKYKAQQENLSGSRRVIVRVRYFFDEVKPWHKGYGGVSRLSISTFQAEEPAGRDE